MTIEELFNIYIHGEHIEKNGKNRSYYYISLLIRDLFNINLFTLKNIFANKYFQKRDIKKPILKFYCFVCKKLNIRRNEVVTVNKLISYRNFFSSTNSERFSQFVLSDNFDKKHILDLDFFFKKHFPVEIRDSLLRIKDFDIYFAAIHSLSHYVKSHKEDILDVANKLGKVTKTNLTFTKFINIFSNSTKYKKIMGIFFLNSLKLKFIRDIELLKLKKFLNNNIRIIDKNLFNRTTLNYFYGNEVSDNWEFNLKHKSLKDVKKIYQNKFLKIKYPQKFENVLYYLDTKLKSNFLSEFNDKIYQDCISYFFDKREERYYLSQIFLIIQGLMSEELYKNNFLIYKSKFLQNASKDDGYYIYMLGFEFIVPKADKIKFVETANRDVFSSNIVDYVLRIDFSVISTNLRKFVKEYFCSQRMTLVSMRTYFNSIKDFDNFMQKTGESAITLNLLDRYNLTLKNFKKSYIRLKQIALYGFLKFLSKNNFLMDYKVLQLDTVVKEPQPIGVKHIIPTDENINNLKKYLSSSNNSIDHICLQILRICDFYQPRLSEILALRIDNVINSSKYGNTRISSPNKISTDGKLLSVIIKEPNLYELVNQCYEYNVLKNNGSINNEKFLFQFENRDGYFKVPSTETVAKHFKRAMLKVGADKSVCNFMSIRRYFINKMHRNKELTLIEKKNRARHTPNSHVHGIYLKLTKNDIPYFENVVGLINFEGKEFIDHTKYNKELPIVSKCLFCRNFYCRHNIADYVEEVLPQFKKFEIDEKNAFESKYVTTIRDKLIKLCRSNTDE